ncbi:MAG: ZIP family metal transporter [Deltaproteobacteria bacterium]|nr:ZIP family metal transporter [Deltaproteobacteria bacterium]
MGEVWLYSLLSVIAVSLISLIGVIVLSIKREVLNRIVFILVSLAVGALFGDTLIHLLPEAYASFDSELTVAYLVMVGFLLFFLVEKYFHWHHHHDEESGIHVHPVGYISLVSDGIHNFIDGILIGVSYLVSIPLGIATTLAVILHEIPQEIGDFGVLISAGFSRQKAVLLNFATGLTAVLGTVLAIVFGGRLETLAQLAIPLTAGGFLYIAAVDLLPPLHKETRPFRSLIQLLAIIAGVAIMAWLKIYEG